MKISYRKAKVSELKVAFSFLKNAALTLKNKGLSQWDYWLDPPQHKIDWIKDGFHKNEFYFIQYESDVVGMFRLLEKDEVYWRGNTDLAQYIHSFVINENWKGLSIGEKVLKEVIENSRRNGYAFFRLDCNASNLNLCKYYERIGFQKVGEVNMFHSLNSLYQINF